MSTKYVIISSCYSVHPLIEHPAVRSSTFYSFLLKNVVDNDLVHLVVLNFGSCPTSTASLGFLSTKITFWSLFDPLSHQLIVVYLNVGIWMETSSVLCQRTCPASSTCSWCKFSSVSLLRLTLHTEIVNIISFRFSFQRPEQQQD